MADTKSGKSNSAEVLIISEVAAAGILGNSERAKEAWKGILEYVRVEKPDAIFFDGAIPSVKDPEMFVEAVRKENTLEEKIAASINIATEYLHELHDANPSSQIYVARTDEDLYNVERLTKEGLNKRKKKYKAEGSVKEATTKGIRAEMARAKDAGRMEEWRSLRGKLGAISKQLKDLEERGAYRQPERGSPERGAIQQEAFESYFGVLQAMNPFAEVAMADTISVEINGVRIQYTHNGNDKKTVLADRSGKLLKKVKKIVTTSEEIPHMILEGGHHGESTTQFVRHPDEENDPLHDYTFVGTGLTMEDQELAAEIADGGLDDVLMGKWKQTEGMARHTKKNPASGIIFYGRNGEGHCYEKSADFEHLRTVGRGEVSLEEIEWDTLYLISDIHAGKFSTNNDAIRKVMQEVEDHVDRCLKEGAPFPVLVFLNEWIQAFNYKTMPAEEPSELRSELDKRMNEQIASIEAAGGSKDDVIEALKTLALKNAEDRTLFRLEDQVKHGHDLMNRAVTWLLMNTDRDVAMIAIEGNHTVATVGEAGITECFLQTDFVRELDRYTRLMEEKGYLKKGTIDAMYEKIRIFEEGLISSFDTLNLKSGDLTHKIVAEHKPGGGGSSAIKSHQKRLDNLAVRYDLSLAGHQHQAAAARVGKEPNRMANIVKAATFSGHDSYGKRGGFPPPTEGYVVVKLPRTKGAEGTLFTEYKFGGALYKDL